MSHIIEEWKPVVDRVGRYEVSNLGRVRNCQTGHILNPTKNPKNGYMAVGVPALGTQRKRTKLVHDIVAKAFLGPRPPGFCINHIDGKKANNRADNLEYVTPLDNIRHALILGLMPLSPRNRRRKTG